MSLEAAERLLLQEDVRRRWVIPLACCDAGFVVAEAVPCRTGYFPGAGRVVSVVDVSTLQSGPGNACPRRTGSCGPS